jgi:hypothetical protein
VTCSSSHIGFLQSPRRTPDHPARVPCPQPAGRRAADRAAPGVSPGDSGMQRDRAPAGRRQTGSGPVSGSRLGETGTLGREAATVWTSAGPLRAGADCAAALRGLGSSGPPRSPGSRPGLHDLSPPTGACSPQAWLLRCERSSSSGSRSLPGACSWLRDPSPPQWELIAAGLGRMVTTRPATGRQAPGATRRSAGSGSACISQGDVFIGPPARASPCRLRTASTGVRLMRRGCAIQWHRPQ